MTSALQNLSNIGLTGDAGRSIAPAAGQAVRGRPRGDRRLGLRRAIHVHGALGPALLLVAWGLLSATGVLDPRALPAPWTVVRTFHDLIASGRLQADLLTSAQRAALGMFIGVPAGVALALIAGLSRLGEAVVDGPIQIKRAVSSLALIPLLILWLGIGEEMKVVTVALTVLIPVYMQVHTELRAIDARYVELAESVGLSRRQFITRVALPSALPGLFLGLRLAMAAAWLALVVVEQINATSGVGYMMSLARSYGQTEIVIVGLVVYGLLGLTSDLAVRFTERKVLSWRRTLAA